MNSSSAPLRFTQSFEANLKDLPAMLKFARTHIAKCGFDVRDGQRFEVAVEEALANVIFHAYGDRGGEVEITVCYLEGKGLQFVIKDRGFPFNPLEHKVKLDKDLKLHEREVGGLGIPMIQEFVDRIHYERQDPFNIFTLEKSLRSN